MALHPAAAQLLAFSIEDGPTVDDVANGHNETVTSANGTNGNGGANGVPGTHSKPPGAGQDGDDGTGSFNAFNGGDSLVFNKGKPFGTWSMTATAGAGGDGGDGGNAGTFPHGTHYAVVWPSGGNGGDGKVAGEAQAELDSRTIYGHRGTGATDGIFLTATATEKNAGDGGNGGNADGDATSATQGGNGGNGGDGGNCNDAHVELASDTFATSKKSGGEFDTIITLNATGGNGGNGGDGGVAGPSSGTPGTAGSGGSGGVGGFASVALGTDRFNLAGNAGDTAKLSLLLVAVGGDGGNGGASPVPTMGGNAGAGGGVELSMQNVAVIGGAENDTVQLELNAAAGEGGVDDQGGHAAGGLLLLNINHNTFDGGGGVNTLAFSWDDVSTTTLSVHVNLAKHTLTVNDGTASSVKNFQNVTGGDADDTLTGDNHANILKGAGGADLLHGGKGADTFVFDNANESTGPHHDTIDDLDFATDELDLGFDIIFSHTLIKHATVSTASFNHDLGKAADKHHLAAHGFALVRVDHGDLAHHEFLVVDFNGKAGYQNGDLVIDVTGAHGNFADAHFT